MRIVSLSPSITEILIGLKAGNELVGTIDVCEVDGTRLEQVGSPKSIQIKKIEALSPDWVLVDSHDNRPEDIQLIQKKWRTKIFEAKKLDQVCDAVTELGRLVEKKCEAARLNEAIQREVLICQEVFRDHQKKRTVLLIWDTPYLTVNFDTYASHLMEASGGVNVFRREPLREFPVEMEDMIEKDPEILLLCGEPAPFHPKHIDQFRKYRIFSKIPIHIVDGKLLGQYGAQTVEALRKLRNIYEG